MELLAKTFHGLEDVLADEIKEIGGVNIQKLNRAVSFEGDKKVMYRANMALRTALNILKPIKKFTIENQNDFYEQARSIEWDSFFKVRKTILVNATVSSEIFDHSHFLSLYAPKMLLLIILQTKLGADQMWKRKILKLELMCI
jgi:putative N6-adenine-specific DNA methylase